MDEFEELTSNIKSMLDRQDKLEKSDEEIKKDLHDMKSIAGRMRKAASPTQSALIDSIETALIENKEGFKNLGTKSIDKVSFEVKAAPSDMITNPGSITVSQVQPGIVTIPPRPVHIRELFTIRPLNTAYVAYLKETSTDGNISAVRAGSMKPQLSMNLSEVQVKAQVLAGWVRVSTAMMDDITDLAGYLSYRLSENLLVKEDDEILNGDGFDPNLPGLLLAANHTAKTGSATIFVEKLVEAVGQMAGYGRRASGIIVNPVDFYAMMILKAVTSGDYTNPVVIQVTPSGGVTLLGIPVVWSAAITSGNYLVGDFQTGAALYQRMAPTIQAFYQDSTNVRENMVTIRIEERICMPVYSAQAFIYPT